jgi:hypothetical protein
MRKTNVWSWYGLFFTDLVVLVVRPGYRIDSRTIKRSSQVSNFIVSFGERAQTFASLASSFLVLFGSYPWEDLDIVLISMTSSSSSKMVFICILYCVYDVGGFTGISFIDRSNIFKIYFYPPFLNYDGFLHDLVFFNGKGSRRTQNCSIQQRWSYILHKGPPQKKEI